MFLDFLIAFGKAGFIMLCAGLFFGVLTLYGWIGHNFDGWKLVIAVTLFWLIFFTIYFFAKALIGD